MNIEWKKVKNGYKGIDQDKNKYYQPENQETTNCVLKDGRNGFGWTPEAAYNMALAKTL